MMTKAMRNDDKYIREQLKHFKLVDIRENYQIIIEEAIKEN